MARAEQAIFTNMCMIYDDKGNILVQDRLNPDWPGLTFKRILDSKRRPKKISVSRGFC